MMSFKIGDTQPTKPVRRGSVAFYAMVSDDASLSDAPPPTSPPARSYSSPTPLLCRNEQQGDEQGLFEDSFLHLLFAEEEECKPPGEINEEGVVCSSKPAGSKTEVGSRPCHHSVVAISA
jgi:hypothetical protein